MIKIMRWWLIMKFEELDEYLKILIKSNEADEKTLRGKILPNLINSNKLKEEMMLKF